MVGVNGTGKTTTAGKLASLYRKAGDRPLVCAADTFRAAAVEQIEIWAARAGVDIVRAQPARIRPRWCSTPSSPRRPAGTVR